MKEKVKEIAKRSKLLIVMCILSFAMGCFLAVCSKGDPFEARLQILFIGYLPFLVFLVLMIFNNLFYEKRELRIFLKILSWIFSSLLLFYFFVAFIMIAFIEALHPVTDIKSYQDKVKGDWLLKVFPKEVPNHVESIQFYYAPGILQGGTVFALYYVDKNMNLEKLDKKYRKNSIWTGKKEEYTEFRGLFSGAFSETPAVYKNENDFYIYLMDANCNSKNDCNHGRFLFVAVNEKTKEVIYKGEEW